MNETIIMKAQPVIKTIEEEIKNNAVVLPRVCIFANMTDPASKIYVGNKIKKFQSYGVDIRVEDVSCMTKDSLAKEVENNKKENIPYMFQEPYYEKLSKECKKYAEEIPYNLDMDSTSVYSVGEFYSNPTTSNSPCTPFGIIKLLKHYIPKEKIENCNAVVIGRSGIVGRPMARLLEKVFNCTVTICHSKTKDLQNFTKNADLIVCAVGKEKLLTKEMIKEGSIIVDVGINRNAAGKVVGDADFEELKDKVYAITPVPGGVGPMTVATLTYKTILFKGEDDNNDDNK